MAKEWAKRFYNSRAWQTVRRQALQRDCYTCAYCDARAEEVHHTVELTQYNIHDDSITLNPDLLISLCHDCHTKITKGEGDIRGGYMFDEDGQAVKV